VRRHARSHAGPSSVGAPVLLLIVFLGFLALPTPAALAAGKQVVGKIGSADVGETGGLFNSPRGVAVNQSGAGSVPAGTFYVVDSKNRRIQRFDPDGAFVSTWGWRVRAGNDEFEICTKAEECRKDPGGTSGAAGSLGSPQTIAVDQSNGKVYVSDPDFLGRIDVFSAKGAFEGAFGFEITGDFSQELQFCTMQSGCAEGFFANGQGGAFPEGIGGLAVDAAGDVYVANSGYRRVDVFKPILTGTTVTGVEFLRSFGWGVETGNSVFEVCTVSASCQVGLAGNGLGQFAENSPSDVAVDSEGNVYALDAGNKRVQKLNSTPEPVDAAFGSAALESLFGAEAQLFNIAVDPSATPNHLLVSGSRTGSEGKVAIAELDGSGGNALGAGEAHGEDLPVASANGLAAAKQAIGGNLYLSTETVGVLRGVFVLGEVPTIEPVTDVTGTTALFKGQVVSNEIGVTYHFEYSTDGKTWTRVPASDVDAGSSPGTIPVQAKAEGLTGSQLYRVRLVQNRPLGGGVATSAETEFTTLAEKPAILGTLASPIEDTSATFNAYLDPQNEATVYRFEYGAADCSANACAALPLSEASGGGLRLVAQTVTGLEPATLYHFRLIATNATGTTEGPDQTFETFASGAQLPEDRAYELVTPPDTGAVVLAGTAFGESDGRDCFDLFPATADGNSVVTMSKGGSLPGLDVNGRWDLYESVRDPVEGWSTIAKSASGTQSTLSQAGLCPSPDHLFSTLGTQAAPGDEGSLVVDGKQSNYVRVPGGVVDEACSPEPEGLFELIGCGSLGVDPEANARWITEKATHIVFSSREQLEPGAPPSGTEAVYDRSPGGPNQVVSLLPGDVIPGAGQDAQYQGTSADGSTVAFKLGGTMYLRSDNTATLPIIDDSGAAVGTTLTCSTTTAATTIGFQWLRNGAPIPGATSASYTTALADAGMVVQCQVFALDANAGSTQVSNPAVVAQPAPPTAPPVAPNNIAQPAQSDSLNVPGPPEDRTLTCNPGTWTGSPTFTYQWYQNGAAIAGATASTYVVTSGSLSAAAAFQCAVTGANTGGSVTTVSANVLTSPAPSPPAPVANSSTGTGSAIFGGLSRDGEAIFYEHRGNLFAFDTGTEATAQIAVGAKFVNVSEDGSHIYFISTSVLTGAEENELGQKAEAGKDNLYLWDRASKATHFIAIVDPKDVAGAGGAPSLTKWTSDAVHPEQSTVKGRADDPSRTTPDGSVLLFESRANITGYDSGGHIEIYRYDAGTGALDCVSCPPDGIPASGDARLQASVGTPLQPASSIVHLQNTTDDGQKVFFQTEDALAPADVNDTWDVYEWKPGQQSYLISSGKGQLPSHLYAMTSSGSDVFFLTAERLVPQDLSTVISIYDAREGGGFAFAESQPPCQGDNCQGTPSAAPPLPSAGSASFQGPGNESRKRKRRCSKNQRRVRRNGKIRCVKKRSSKAAKRRHRTNHERRAAR
jgi:NHL repeat-containing protein